MVNNKEKKKPTFINYSGLGIQTVLIIGLGAYLGNLLDQHYKFDTRWFSLVLVLISVALSIAFTIKTLNRWNN